MFGTGRPPKALKRGERGQVLLLFVALFTVVLILGAFAIDQGMWLGHRRVSQKDADVAARAGAMAYLNDPTDSASAQAQAQSWAGNNGAPSGGITTTASTSGCTGPYVNGGQPIAGVPWVQAVIDAPQPSLFGRAFGGTDIDISAGATACVGVPTSLSGGEPFFTAPGGAPSPACFQASGQPAIGKTCVFKTNGGGNTDGNFGTLSLSDTPAACTTKNKTNLGEQVAEGSQATCSVGDVVDTATGSNSGDITAGVNCRLTGNSQSCGKVQVNTPPPGEGFCDGAASFHDSNGSIPPFGGPLSASGIDDFTEVFSLPTGGAPGANWATSGAGGDAQTLIPNVCSNGVVSPRVLTIILGEPCPATGCGNTITVAGFATFYLFGCVYIDPTGVVSPDDVQCTDNGNQDNALEGVFVKAYIPEGGGTPAPPVLGASLSIFLVQ